MVPARVCIQQATRPLDVIHRDTVALLSHANVDDDGDYGKDRGEHEDTEAYPDESASPLDHER